MEDPRRPVTAATYPQRDEAEIVRARLGSAGIPAVVAADDEGGLSPGFFRFHGVRVLVAEEDLPRAQAELAAGDRDR